MPLHHRNSLNRLFAQSRFSQIDVAFELTDPAIHAYSDVFIELQSTAQLFPWTDVDTNELIVLVPPYENWAAGFAWDALHCIA